MPQRLLNRYEELTYTKLTGILAPHGAKAFPKVRVADVLTMSAKSINPRTFSYGLKAHFDFVVTDSNYAPLFAVEFDGPSHLSARQQERDALKNHICESFDFPLLRINANYLEREFRQMDLFTYCVDVWFLAEAFGEAQRQGAVPLDEDFDPTWIASIGTKKRFPYWLSAERQSEIRQLHKNGRIADSVPSRWIGTDADGNYRCLSWIEVTPKNYAVIRTGMRNQSFPIDTGDVISQIAVFDIFDRISDTLSGRIRSHTETEFVAILREYERRYRIASFSGHCNVSLPSTTWPREVG